MTFNIAEFKGYLQIDRSSLDDEVMRQASLLFTVSEAVVEATAKRDALKDFLAKMEAEIDQELRAKFEASGDKYTEGQIKSLILTEKSRCLTNKNFLAAKAEVDLLVALKDAFQARGYMLRDLVSLYTANYYQNDSVRATPKMGDAVYSQRRARLAEGRTNRGE